MSGGAPLAPLVLLHGFTGSPASWDDVRAHIPPEVQVLAPALPGHDGTPGSPGARSFDDEVDRLAARVEAAGAAVGRVAGYSLGGRVALGLLVRRPGLFGSAVLIGASPGLGDPTARESRREEDERRARLLETEGLSTFVAAWEAMPLFGTQTELPAPTQAHQRQIRLSHDPLGLARSLRTLGLAAMPDLRPALARIDVPVRLVAGGLDVKFRELARSMADRIPRAEVRVVEGAGHNVVLERPEEVARLIQEPFE